MRRSHNLTVTLTADTPPTRNRPAQPPDLTTLCFFQMLTCLVCFAPGFMCIYVQVKLYYVLFLWNYVYLCRSQVFVVCVTKKEDCVCPSSVLFFTLGFGKGYHNWIRTASIMSPNRPFGRPQGWWWLLLLLWSAPELWLWLELWSAPGFIIIIIARISESLIVSILEI